jgi:hypothetical protein
MMREIDFDFFARHKNKFVYLFYCLVLLAAYYPAITNLYAYTDDYYMFLGPKQYAWTFDLMISGGRIGYAISYYFLTFLDRTLESLLLIRSFNLLGLMVCTCFFHYLIEKLKIFDGNYYLTIFVPIFLMLLPSVQVFIAWTALYEASLSMLLALFSYYYIRLSQKEISVKRKIIKTVISIICLLIAFSLYQVSAMIFLIPMIAEFCLSNKKITIKEILPSFLVLCFGMLAALFMAKFLSVLLLDHAPLERTKLSLDFLTVLTKWSTHAPMTMAVNNYLIDAFAFWTSCSLILIFIGWFCIPKQDKIIKIIMLPVFVIASYAPDLLTDQLAFHHMIAVLAMAITMVLLYGGYKLSNFVFVRLKIKQALFVLPLILIFFAVLSAQKNIVERYVIPFEVEYHGISAYLSTLPKDKEINLALFIRVKDNKGDRAFIFPDKTIKHDFAVPGSLFGYSAPALVQTVIDNKGLSNIKLVNPSFYADDKDAIPKVQNLYILNISDLIDGLRISNEI